MAGLGEHGTFQLDANKFELAVATGKDIDAILNERTRAAGTHQLDTSKYELAATRSPKTIENHLDKVSGQGKFAKLLEGSDVTNSLQSVREGKATYANNISKDQGQGRSR